MILPHTALQKLENKLQLLQPQSCVAFFGVERAKMLPGFYWIAKHFFLLLTPASKPTAGRVHQEIELCVAESQLNICAPNAGSEGIVAWMSEDILKICCMLNCCKFNLQKLSFKGKGIEAQIRSDVRKTWCEVNWRRGKAERGMATSICT